MNYLICFKIRKSSCVLYKVGLMRFKVTPQDAIIFATKSCKNLLKSKIFLNHSAHITPLLHDLHWLPVASRIHFKKWLLTFKALNGLAPPHLSDILHSYSLPYPGTSDHLSLFFFHSSLSAVHCGRSFSVNAPKLWNSSKPSHFVIYLLYLPSR